MKLSPISASFGAMGSLPQKLDELLSTGHWALSGVVMDEIEELTADLHILCNLLLKLSNVHDPPPTVRFWMKEVRELSYDVEDCADQFVIANDRAVMRRAKIHRATIRTIIITRLKISRLPKRRKWRLWMTDKVAEFRTRVQDATQRYWRYKFDDCASNPGYASVGHEFATVYAQPGDLVGIEGPMDELEQWLTDGEEQLKVISIVGLGGVGKTTLAQKLWATLKGQFLCRAFVRTAQKPDMRGILRNILLQVRPHQLPNRGEMHHLIHDLREYLQDKRYFVIIDDLWAASVWDVVSRAFPEGNCCSRIVTTTEIMEVALACCDYCPKHICKLETLSDDDSEKLLLERIVVSGNQIPQQLDDVLPQIMRNCGGLPLAIIIVASLLVSQPEKLEQWGHTQNSFGSIFGTNPTMEGFIRQILSISFNSLPYYLKTCLLYLSSYPEGCLFLKDDLVKLWVAEGFIHAKEWEDMEDLAGRYFDELVNVGLIQVMDINYNYKLPSYSVHHMVLDFITCKSIEENFITVVDYSETTTPLTDKVRRLSLHFGSATHATTPASARLSNVRSLFYFGLFNCMPSFMVFKLLRVLILNFWGDPGNTSFNLTGICELVWLRYLQVSCNVTVKLPDQIESMGHLETLEIKAKVYAVPLDIVRLSSLSHLHLRGGTIPNGIGCMRSLRTLKYFDLVNKSVDNLRGLGELANLRDLHLTYSSSLPSEHLKRNLIALASSLGKLCNLKSLTLASETAATVVPFDGSISMSSTPAFLERLELLPSICIFSRLPKWIFQFQKLCILKVAVRELLANDIDSITGLPSLTVLSLCVHTAPGQRIVFNDGAFPVLKYFKFRCGVLSMSFMAGAMPNLRRLKLGFNTHVGEKYGNMLAGIEHLLNLQDIAGKIGVATESDRKAAESAIKGAISKHPQSPMLNVQWVDLVEEEYHASEKQHGRQEKGLSGENHAVLEKAKDTKKHADSGVSQLPDLPSTVSSSRLKSENIAQASKHHVLESMLCDESAQPESLEVSVLEDITNNFSDDQEISKNRFVVVYKGELQNGSVVVVKRFTIAIDYNLFLDAVDCLMSVKHNNIVRFLGYCANSQENAAKEGSKSVSVVTQERLCCFEYLRNGNLQMHLTDESCGFDWQMWYQIIEGICQGVHYLHNKSITPLNLNPANIMFDDKMVPKIVHYAYTRFLGQATSPVLTNIDDLWAYMAPEYFGFGEVTSKSDIYSLGVIIMQIVTGENKKDFPSIQSVLESWRSRLESDGSQGHTSLETCYLQVNLCYLIGIRCIEHDPGKRPNTRDIIDSLDTLEIMECLVKHDVGNSSLEQMLVCSKVEEPKALPAPPSVSCKLKMAMMVDPPNGTGNHGKHYYTMWQTMFEINTKYMPIKPIGRGAYGIVCSSTNQENNEKVAIKKINNVFDNRMDALRTLRELKLLRHLRHENVIALKDIMMPVHRRSFKDVYLVFELMDTDLHQIIKSSQPLSNDHCQYFLFQLLRGLKYLHSAGILHRDLKPGNLLVNANCDLKICDFGLARTNNTKGQFMTEYVVTRLYRAPELLLCCDNYGTSIDVWSVGCIFAELLGRKPIFPRTQCLDQLKLIVNVLGTMSENDLEFIDNPKARKYIKSLPYTPGTPLTSMYPQAHPLAIDLLQKMLVFDPSKRISVTEALEHPYMSPLYDPSANPPAQVPIDLDIDENLGVEMIREMLWQEMLQYHPEAARMVNM